MKKTVVIGASTNPSRYSFQATTKLNAAKHEVIPIGIKKGDIEGIEIVNGTPEIEDVDTVTLYINPKLQEQYYDYILSLKPKRILFNPGTENPVLMKLAQENGIEVEAACTLVLLSMGNY